jgi:hypothetical protein
MVPKAVDFREDENSYKKYLGYGAAISYLQYYPIKGDDNMSVFWSMGAQYVYFDISYEASGWANTTYEGLEALAFGWYERKTYIDQYSGLVNFGVKWNIDYRFFVELFAGARIKYAEHRFLRRLCSAKIQ